MKLLTWLVLALMVSACTSASTGYVVRTADGEVVVRHINEVVNGKERLSVVTYERSLKNLEELEPLEPLTPLEGLEPLTPEKKDTNDGESETESDCGVFQMPEVTPMPRFPEITEAQNTDLREANDVLLSYVGLLRGYIRQSFTTIDDAYSAYLQSCGRE